MKYPNSNHIDPLEKNSVISSFDKFDSGAEIKSRDALVTRITTGFLHDSYLFGSKKTPRKFVIQKLRPIFDLNAINNNLKLFENAEERSGGIIPDYWQKVHYANVSGTSDKIYFNEVGEAWRVMEYLPGDIRIYNSFSEVTKDKNEIAHSLGQAIAIFGKILTLVPVSAWKEPLPNFHNAKYHYEYLSDILKGKEVTLSLSHNPDVKVRMDPKFNTKYKSRINELVKKIEKRSGLVNGVDDLGETITHGDLKINNAVFRADGKGFQNCITLIDLDTIQKGGLLDDLSDALRSSGSTAGEEPKSLDQVSIDLDVVKSITSGFLDKTKFYKGDKFGNRLVKLIPTSYKKFLYMQGIRFFADSLVGNKYFRLVSSQREDANLYRAEVQIRALEEVEKLFIKKEVGRA